MNLFGKIAIPAGILAVASGVTWGLMATRKKPESKPVEPKPTLVQAIPVVSHKQTLSVVTQGTVEPLRQTVLSPEISGRIVTLSPAFQAGGFFELGEVLIEIDPANYESAVAQAEFNLAQARLKLEQERARAEQARKEWQNLSRGEPPPLAVRVPQLQAEEASVRWSEQALARAKLDLERTKLRAPYAGMVREKRADVGLFVSPGTQLGTIFAIDVAEVRLPISSVDVAYLDLPLAFRGEAGTDVGGPAVTLRTRIAGEMHTWAARIVRTEGTIDPTNRMLYAVARVQDPYGRANDLAGPPLPIGMFVEAEITGRTMDDIVVLPRQVLRGSDRVLVVDARSNELRTRTISVLKTDPNTVAIAGGLEPGELVCTTALEFVVEGMKVELYSDAPGSALPLEAGKLADNEKAAKPAGGAL